MDRKILKFVFVASLGFSPLAFAAGALVFDATNAPRFGTLISEAKKQFQQFKKMSDTMEALKGQLGGLKPDQLSRLNGSAREWGVFLDGLGSPESDNLSLLKMSGYRGASKLPEINQFLNTKLYPPKTGTVSYGKLDEIKKFRSDAIEHSATNSLSLAGEKKHSLRNTQRKIAELGSEAVRSPTIHDDLVITNKLLAMMAIEMTHHREILAQQLELDAAVITQGTSMSNRSVGSP